MKKLIINSLLLASILPLALNAASFKDSGTDYTNEQKSFYTKSDATGPVKMANVLMCVFKDLRGDAMVNQPKYSVLIDLNKCLDDGSSKSSKSSEAPKKMYTIAQSTRASDTSNQIVKMWVPKFGEEPSSKISGKLEIIEAPSASNSVGKFNITFTVESEGETQYKAEVIGSVGASGKSIITYYEENIVYSESSVVDTTGNVSNVSKSKQKYTSKASISKSTNGASGVALIQEGGYEPKTYALVWNDLTAKNMVLEQSVRDTVGTSGDFRNNGSKQCFDKTKFTKTVYEYGLYDQTTGKLLTINTGFPIEATDKDNNKKVYGYIGYSGTWIEGNKGVDQLKDVKRIIDYSTKKKEAVTLTSVKGVLYETTNSGWKRINSLKSNLSLNASSGDSYSMNKDTMEMIPNLSIDTTMTSSDGARTFQFVAKHELTIVKSNGRIITLDAPKNIDYKLKISDIYSETISVYGEGKSADDIINIQYGGRGNLSIPPKKKYSPSYDYKPAFTFKDETILSVGGKNYVTQALSGVRELDLEDTATCDSLDLNKINSLTLPAGTTNSFNTDAMPTPEDEDFPTAVSFINGVRVNNSN